MTLIWVDTSEKDLKESQKAEKRIQKQEMIQRYLEEN